jgi:S1-C subfamily serine protease
MKVHRHLLAAFGVIGLVGGGAVLHSGLSSPTAHATPSVPTDGTIADVAERTVDSVVNISVSRGEQSNDGDDTDPFGQSRPHKTGAKGSGVIVTASGRILTNAHVVDGFDTITVTLQDGTELDAKVIGKDTRADLAVLQLKGNVPKNLKPLPFGDSSALRLGDIVLAVGDGMGVGKSVSMGIVSAKNRHFDGAGQQPIEEYEDFIQTDAAINPGNSGGALVNLKGELVGINTAIASRSGGYQGVGFAIPSNMARPIMEMLVQDGKVSRGYLGVHIETVNAKVAKEDKLAATSGVEVKDVEPNGPAALAKLQSGDVIVALDGRAMKDGASLRNTIALIRPGTVVALEVVHRDGNRNMVKAKLGELPEQQLSQQQQQPPQRQQRQQQPGRRGRGGQLMPPQMPNGNGWNCQQTPNGWQCESHNGGWGQP